jgi:hypothetical protein
VKQFVERRVTRRLGWVGHHTARFGRHR